MLTSGFFLEADNLSLNKYHGECLFYEHEAENCKGASQYAQYPKYRTPAFSLS
jgi:hypothetical protein